MFSCSQISFSRPRLLVRITVLPMSAPPFALRQSQTQPVLDIQQPSNVRLAHAPSNMIDPIEPNFRMLSSISQSVVPEVSAPDGIFQRTAVDAMGLDGRPQVVVRVGEAASKRERLRLVASAHVLPCACRCTPKSRVHSDRSRALLASLWIRAHPRFCSGRELQGMARSVFAGARRCRVLGAER